MAPRDRFAKLFTLWNAYSQPYSFESMARRIEDPPRLDPNVVQRFYDDPRPEVREAVGRADTAKGYLHWNEFRHRPIPSGWKHAELWTLVKLKRLGKALPHLRAKDNQAFVLNRTDPLSAALHRIDKKEKLWKALAKGGATPDQEVSYRLMAAIEEAHHSSAIEGAVTTRRQSRELLRSGREPVSESERMVRNKFQAIEKLDDWVGLPLSPELICEVQSVITHGLLKEADVGRIRRDDDVQILDPLTSDVVYVPPPASELESRIESLCTFINTDQEDDDFVHPVTKAILLHHQIAYDHPFADGNGRTARTLFMWFVLRSGYHWFRSLSISRAVNRAKSNYYRSFIEVQTDGNDTTYFVRQQVRCIEQEIEHLASFLQQRAELEHWLESKREAMRGLNPRQLSLVDRALNEPDTSTTAQAYAQFHGVSQPTAWKDLKNLVSRSLFNERKDGRGFRYSPTQVLLDLSGERPPVRK